MVGTLQSSVFGPKVYLTCAQPEEPGGSGTGHEYQAGAGPKHGELSSSHGTFLQFTQFRGGLHRAVNPLTRITYTQNDVAQAMRNGSVSPTGTTGSFKFSRIL
jgi:hypothetical protein